jgi:hypothetical protein
VLPKAPPHLYAFMLTLGLGLILADLSYLCTQSIRFQARHLAFVHQIDRDFQRWDEFAADRDAMAEGVRKRRWIKRELREMSREGAVAQGMAKDLAAFAEGFQNGAWWATAGAAVGAVMAVWGFGRWRRREELMDNVLERQAAGAPLPGAAP